ncbi:MAG: SpoIID/LytB domain-containing protein [Deltaproteobacteria bacterium]|nr:SpoIID/LytB domain-containing protein [Deltaproteobacteria bacterium]
MRKRQWALVVLLILCVSGCLRVVSGRADGVEKIKVLVVQDARSIEIRGDSGGAFQADRGPSGAVTINGTDRAAHVKVAPRDEFVYLNGKPYRGTVEIYNGKDGLYAVNEVSMEYYLASIINNEISSKWHREAIKAQAVIARTYALYQKRKRLKEQYHVAGNVMGQVYSGADTEDSASFKAVRDTAGEIVAYKGEPALAVYHSNAGGRTDSSGDIWAHEYPYLRGVESPYDPDLAWEVRIAGRELETLLKRAGYKTGELEAVYALASTPGKRVKTVVVQDASGAKIRLSGEDLRKTIGYGTLKSTIFEVLRSGDEFVFKGRGSGHGVGLSQWGAKGMAEAGYPYEKILKHFYPGTDLIRAY